MVAPALTAGTVGGALASQSLAAGATVTFNLNLSASWEGQLIVGCTFGSVSTTSGLRIDIFPGYGPTPTYATTNPNYSYTIPSNASSARTSPKILLPTGRWQVLLTNTDATNGLTAVSATMDTIDSVA